MTLFTSPRRSTSPATCIRSRAFTILLTGALLTANCGGQTTETADGYAVAERVVAGVSESTGEEIVGYSSSTTDVGSAPNELAFTEATSSNADDARSGAEATSIEPADAGPIVIESDCERTVTTDEYGFEQQELICADDPATETTVNSDSPTSTSTSSEATSSTTSDPLNETSTGSESTTTSSPPAIRIQDVIDHEGMLPVAYYQSLLATAPNDEVRSAFSTIGERLDTIERHCGTDPTGWLAELSHLTDEATSATALVKASTDYTGSAEATALARSFTERALMESGCSVPNRPTGSLSPASATAATAKASTAFAGLDQALRNSEYGPLFHQYSTLPNYQWLRNETSTIDAILVGTSQVGAGLEVATMNAQFDTEFGSVQLPGGLAEIQTWWIPQVTKEVDPSMVIWFVGPLDLFVGCPTGGRDAQYRKFDTARSDAFSRNGWLSNVEPLDRILGQPTPSNTVQGDAPKRKGFDPDSDAYQRDRYPNQFSTRKYCDARAATIGNESRRLEAEGRRVIVVGMPIHPDLATARPGGAAGFADDLATFASSNLTGIEFVDLTTTMQDARHWSDLTHLHAAGASEFTQLVIAGLREQGIS